MLDDLSFSLVDQAARLNSLNSLNLWGTRTEERFDRVTRLAGSLFDGIAYFALIGEHDIWIKSSVGPVTPKWPKSTSPCHQLEESSRLIRIDNLDELELGDHPLYFGEEMYPIFLGRPIQLPNGHTIGALCVQTRKQFELTDRSLDDLRDLAGLLEQELLVEFRIQSTVDESQTDLPDQMQRRNLILEAVNDIALSESEDFNTLLFQIVEVICNLVNGTSAYILQVDVAKRTEVVMAEYISPEASEAEKVSDLGEIYDIVADDGVADWETSKVRFYTTSIHQDDLSVHEREHLEQFGGNTFLKLPIHVDRTYFGIVEIWDSRGERDFSLEEIELLEAIIAQIASVIRRVRLVNDLQDSERRYQYLESTIPDVIIRHDVSEEMTLMYVSPSSSKVIQYEPDDLKGESALKFIHPDDLNIFVNQIYFAIAYPGEKVINRFRFLKKDGDWLWLESTGVALMNPHSERMEFQTVNRDITERKMVEDALLENEVRYRKISEILTDFVWEVEIDPDGTIQSNWVVGPMGKIAGVNSLAAHVDNVARLTHPDDSQQVIADFQRTLENHQTQTEYRHLAHGAYIWVRVMRMPIWDEAQNRVTKIIGSVKDITSEKATELALRESEQRHRFITENLTDMISRHRLDSEMTISFVSDSSSSLVGYASSELIDSSLVEKMHPDDYLRNRRLIDYAINHPGENITTLFRMRHQNGYYIWIESTGRVMLNPMRNEMEYIVVSRDVTKRKQVEEILRREQHAFHALYQTALGIMNRFDLQDLLINLLSRISKLMDVDQAELYITDEHNNQLRSIGYLYKGEPRVRDHAQVRGEGLIGLTWDREVPVIVNNYDDWPHGISGQLQKEDEVPPKAAMAVPLKVGIKVAGVLEVSNHVDGKIFFDDDADMLLRFGNLAALAIDNARLYQQVRDAQMAAEIANRAKSIYLTNMSHELRTPLNAILGFTQLMVRDEKLDTISQERLETIARSGEHLLVLINNVLELSKIEAGQIDVLIKPFDLYSLFSDVMNMLAIRSSSKKIVLALDIHPDVPQFVAADEAKLRQVLINLIGNAIKFTENGSVKITAVYASMTRKLICTVSDTGIGIPSEEIDKIFEPFGQSAQLGQDIEGSGLGLPISRKYVQLMGGDIQVFSQLGQGSAFVFDIDIQIVKNHQAPVNSDLQQIPVGRMTQGEFRILLVEDNDENLALLTSILTPFDFDLRAAQNGEEAVAISNEWEPDLIFMDVRMPKMSGLDATHHIRSNKDQPQPKIVAITASAFEHEREAVIHSGCNDLILKPFKINAIVQTLEEHLDIEFEFEANERVSPPPYQETQNAMLQLPLAVKEGLKSACALLDADEVKTILSRLDDSHLSTVDKIEQHIQNFEFELILSLLDES